MPLSSEYVRVPISPSPQTFVSRGSPKFKRSASEYPTFVFVGRRNHPSHLGKPHADLVLSALATVLRARGEKQTTKSIKNDQGLKGNVCQQTVG